MAQEHKTVNFHCPEGSFVFFQEGAVHQLTVCSVIQESDLIQSAVVIAAAMDVVGIVIIENAAGILAAAGFIDGCALGIGEDHLMDGDTSQGDGFSVGIFHQTANGFHSGCGFPGKLLGFGFRGNQMHVLAGYGDGIGQHAVFQLRIPFRTSMNRLSIYREISSGHPPRV